jgi:hypothetical protein
MAKQTPKRILGVKVPERVRRVLFAEVAVSGAEL